VSPRPIHGLSWLLNRAARRDVGATHEERILAFRADEYYWRDLGRPDNLMQAAQDLKQKVLL
jgi:NDP-sugar pyrophosphorylase family protein